MENERQLQYGLHNLGNTCCINTTLQCIRSLVPIRDWIASKQSNTKKELLLTMELRDVLQTMRDASQPVAPRKFVTALQRIFEAWIEPGDQLDISEIWTLIVDTIDEECKRTGPPPKAALSFVPTQQNQMIWPLYCKAETEWFTKHCLSEWSRHTKWLLVCQVHCKHCNEYYHNFESFSSLPISIKSSSEAIDLQACFEEYFGCERLDADGWKCDNARCKLLPQNAERVMRIWRAPAVLAISLKRTLVSPNGRIEKIQTPVNIPDEICLDKWHIFPNVSRRAAIYSLTAMGIHYGTLQNGHYQALCKRESKENWSMFDDDNCFRVKNVDAIYNNNSAAYMLFYVRKN
jgi:ubiquitin C-terminal hydrolase